MSEEKRRILEMLEAGTISQKDAQRLLEALGENLSQPAPMSEKPEQDVFEEAAQAVEPALEVPKEEKAAWNAEQAGWQAPPVESTAALALPLEENQYQQPVGGVVTQLKIEWWNGPVEIRPWEGDTIRVAEYSPRPLEDSERMGIRVKNGKLHIQWNENGIRFGSWRLKKHLVVELPTDAVLEEIRAENTSGSLYLAGISLGKGNLETTSGMVYCHGLRAEKMRVETTSGEVQMEGASVGELRVETISGEQRILEFAAQYFKGETVSGALTAIGNGEELKLSTVSGPLTVQVGQHPRKVKLETVSGPVEAVLPEGEPGFTVEYSSLSGRFSSQFPLTGKLGKREGSAVYGSGGTQLHLETVSGSMGLCKGISAGH